MQAGPVEWQIIAQRAIRSVIIRIASVAGNPCKRCQTRVLDFEQHVEERCPSRPDGGVHVLVRPNDLNDIYMAGPGGGASQEFGRDC